MKKLNIIYLEDNPEDVELLRSTIDAGGLNYKMVHVSTRDKFISALEKHQFDIILSDYSLPGFNGIDALAIAYEKYPDTPFIIVSGALGEEAAIETLQSGATDYVLKHDLSRLVPAIIRALKDVKKHTEQKKEQERRRRYDFIVNTSKSFLLLINSNYTYEAVNDAFCEAHSLSRQEILGKKISDIWDAKIFKEIIEKNLSICFTGSEVNYQAWLKTPKSGLRCFEISYVPYSANKDKITHVVEVSVDITDIKRTEEEQKKSYEKLQKAFGGIVTALTSTIEIRDPYTAGHQRRVADIASLVAEQMGLPKNQINGIRIASLVHDIGKIYVPTEILIKPSELTESEFNLIKIHPQAGYDILKSIDFPWPIAKIVQQHHERMDGSGYPYGLEGRNIVLEARIIAVADVLETMASYRPYRPARGIKQALHEITINRGGFYDPEVVDACLKLYKRKKFKFLED